MLKIQLLGFILVSIGLTFVCLGLIFSQTRYYQIASYDRHSDYDGFGFEISHTFYDENEDLGNEIYYNPLKYDYIMAEMVLNATAHIAKICEDWKYNKYERNCDLSRSCAVQKIFSSIMAKYFNVSHGGEYFWKNSNVFEKMLDIYKKYFNAKGSCFYPKKEFLTYGILKTVFINPKSMFLTHEKVLPKIVEKFDKFITTTVKCEIEDKMPPELGFDLIHQQIYMAEIHRFFCYAANHENLAFYDYLFEIFVKLSTIPILALIFFFKPIIPFTIAFVIHTFFSIIWITILGRCKKHFKSDLWIWKIIENSKIENIKEQKRMKKKNKKENKPKRGKKSSKYFVLRSHL